MKMAENVFFRGKGTYFTAAPKLIASWLYVINIETWLVTHLVWLKEKEKKMFLKIVMFLKL